MIRPGGQGLQFLYIADFREADFLVDNDTNPEARHSGKRRYPMDLWQLNILCKVVEKRSFSKAGQAANLSQPTVSSHVKDLEEHFGCRLIDRLSKQAVPTKAGELVYAYAKKLLALVDETENAVAEFLGAAKGRLTLGGSTIPGVYILPKIVGGFAGWFPEVTVSIKIGDTRKIIADTLSGEVELGLVGAFPEDPAISSEKLLDDEMTLVVPANHKWKKKDRITIPTLLKEPFIIREPGSGTLKSFLIQLAKKGYTIDDVTVAAEMGSTAAVIAGIKSGVGVSILSSIAVAEDVAAGRLRTLSVAGLALKRSFYLIYHQKRSRSPLSRKFETHLKQTCK